MAPFSLAAQVFRIVFYLAFAALLWIAHFPECVCRPWSIRTDQGHWAQQFVLSTPKSCRCNCKTCD